MLVKESEFQLQAEECFRKQADTFHTRTQASSCVWESLHTLLFCKHILHTREETVPRVNVIHKDLDVFSNITNVFGINTVGTVLPLSLLSFAFTQYEVGPLPPLLSHCSPTTPTPTCSVPPTPSSPSTAEPSATTQIQKWVPQPCHASSWRSPW